MKGIWRKDQLLKVYTSKSYHFLLCRLWLLISRMRVRLLWLQQLQGIYKKLSRLKTAVLSTGKEMGQQGMTLIRTASSFAALGAAQFNHLFFFFVTLPLMDKDEI